VADMAEDANEALKLTLYIAGQTPKSLAAIRNLEALCNAEGSAGAYEVEVIDLKQHPQLAREHNIIAIPTLVRSLPAPVQKIIGDLSDREKVLVHLQIGPAQ
jgi:circadian clock protein KaiB